MSTIINTVTTTKVSPESEAIIPKCSILRSTSIVYNSTTKQVIATFPNTSTLKDGDCLKIVFAQSMPSVAPVNAQLVIKINGSTFPLICRLGEYVMAMQLHKRCLYHVRLASSVPQFMLLECLKPLDVSYPTYSPSTSITTVTKTESTSSKKATEEVTPQ